MPINCWTRIEDICQAALDRDPRERAAYVEQACSGDEELRQEVEALLAQAQPADELFATSLGAVAAAVFSDRVGSRAGHRIATYEIVSLIGTGGMGEVYRARDTELGRDVAIKVLPGHFLSDHQRLARFEREARALAALNHPNVAAIFGIESIGEERALILELVEGETLAELVATSPSGLPIDKATCIARQIADALEAAHEKGIVHRDLKPANVKVARGDLVKVLDFGLAKAAPASATDVAQSPILTVGATQDGALLGTAAYMSPEQVRGQSVDRRADIWAFGCVLYEMLTGCLAFPGDTVSDHIAAILAREPDWRRLPPATPIIVRRLLRHCLEKDPAKRLRDIGDARLAIDDLLESPVDGAYAERRHPPAWLTIRRVGFAGVVLGAVIASLMFAITQSRSAVGPPVSRVQRFSMSFPSSAPLDRRVPQFALSPDGNQLVYVGAGGRLYLRAFDEAEPRALPGTEGAWDPFFSPDGEWIGYIAAGSPGGFLARPGQLKKVAVHGGTPIFLADAVALGASWARDDTIVFSRQMKDGVSLFEIAASGGSPRQVVAPATRSAGRVGWPSQMPDERTLLFTETDEPTFESGRIVALSRRTGERRVLVEPGFAGRYVASGHLVYAVGEKVMAVGFDSNRMQTLGAPVTLAERVDNEHLDGWPGFTISASGLLLYQTAEDSKVSDRTLDWVARDGTATAVVSDRGAFSYPRLSPDGRRLAVGMGSDIWILDLARGTRSRIAAADRGTNPPPPMSAWTTDGRRLAFNRRNGSLTELVVVDADDVEHPTVLLRRPHLVQLGSWARNGTLAFYQFPGDTERDLWVLESGMSEPRPFLATRFNERGAVFSPNGRWLAYVADPSGRDEVYVRAYPGPSAQIPVSNAGGAEPLWSRDGREIFYREGSRMMAAAFESASTAQPRRPRVVFESVFVLNGLGIANFDVGADGRFVMTRPVDAAIHDSVRENGLVVIQNWQPALKQRVTTK